MREEDIIEVIPVGEDETYDIEVEHEEHSFFANDISVSNSHAISYSIISFQCAHLLTYHPSEWLCSYLNEEPEKTRAAAMSMVKNIGYKIADVDVNTSGTEWLPAKTGKTLIQPLTSIKGFGSKATEQIIENRPFKTVEDLLFNPKVKYQKLNKKCLDVLIRSGACNKLMNNNFNHLRHFWMSTVFDRPKSRLEMYAKIEQYKNEPDFTDEEKVLIMAELTSMFPISLFIDEKVMTKLEAKNIPPISEFNPERPLVWFVPRRIDKKMTKTNRMYWELFVTDGASSKDIKIKCWSPRENDTVLFNRPYVSRLEFDEKYGFSVNWPNKNLQLIG